MSLPDETESRADLAARLRSQTIQVPDILRIYDGWDLHPHPALDASRHDIGQLIRIYIPTEDQREKACKVDSSFCASVFWPRIPADKFIVMGRWMLWVFFWDDEIDCGLLRHDSSKTRAYVEDSIAFIRSSLQPELDVSPPVPGRLHNCGIWVETAKAMLVDHSVADRNRYVDSTVDYLESTLDSQMRRSAGMEQLDMYLDRRARNIGSYQCLTILPWAYGLTLPAWIWEHEAMKRCVHEVATAVFLCNDIFSLKKELTIDDVDSVIPILVHQRNISAQEATDVVVEMLGQSYRDFLAASQRLKDAGRIEGNAIQRDIQSLLRGCTDVIVGNVLFCMHSQRYLASEVFDDEGRGFTVLLLALTDVSR